MSCIAQKETRRDDSNKQHKLECLVALCRPLLHPQLIEEKFGVKKLGVTKKTEHSTQDGIKHPEMQKVKVRKKIGGEKKLKKKIVFQK